jgi:DNA-binding transcriptional LysR family regulator
MSTGSIRSLPNPVEVGGSPNNASGLPFTGRIRSSPPSKAPLAFNTAGLARRGPQRLSAATTVADATGCPLAVEPHFALPPYSGTRKPQEVAAAKTISSTPAESASAGARMDLRRLRYFVAVAEFLHFGRAAQRMHVVQSAISQQIKLLESELGFPLLDRSRSSVKLTEAGRTFLPECRRVLFQADQAVRAARQAAGGRLGTIRVSFIDSALWSLLPPLIRTFRDRYPRVNLELQPRDRVAQVKALEERLVDVLLAPVPAPPSGFESELFVRGCLLAAVPEGHSLQARERIHITELASHDLITFPADLNTRMRELLIGACSSAGFSPSISQEASQIHTQLALVGAGLGIGFVPNWVATSNFQNVRFRPLEPRLEYDLNLIWKRDSDNCALNHFLEVAREVSGTIA